MDMDIDMDMDVNIGESTSAIRALNVKLCLVHEVIVLVSHTEHK